MRFQILDFNYVKCLLLLSLKLSHNLLLVKLNKLVQGFKMYLIYEVISPYDNPHFSFQKKITVP